MSRHFVKVVKSNSDIISSIAVITSTIAAFTIELLPHTFYIQKYQNIVQMHNLGVPCQLDHNLNDLFQNVCKDLNIKEYELPSYKPFPVVGFNLFHAGFKNSKYGSIIGIPDNFTYKDVLSIDYLKIRFGPKQERLNVYHPAAEDLLNSLILSNKAKKFGIAREILMTQRDMPLYCSIETVVMILGTYTMTQWTKLNLANKPPLFKFIVYGATGLLGFAVWFQIRDSLNTYNEKSVDQEITNLGPEYIEGGKEFYEKLLQKNIALRKLLGSSGVSMFNSEGDEIYLIRRANIPITHRKKFFTDILLQNTA